MGAPRLRQDSLQPHFTSPTDVSFQTHPEPSQVSEHTQEFLFPPVVKLFPVPELSYAQPRPLHLDSPWGCSSVAPPKGGPIRTPFYLIILCVVLRALTSPPT